MFFLSPGLVWEKTNFVRRLPWWGVCAALCLTGFSALAEDPDTGRRDNIIWSEDKPKEVKVMPLALPPFPEEKNLQSFYVSPIQTQSFFMDMTSLSVGEDEIRYTLVSVSRSGARNVVYEGVKCSAMQTRRYAMGTYEGKWSPSRHDEWKEIHFHDANRPQAALVLHYFCDGKTISGKKEDILYRVRQKISLKDDAG